MINTEAVQALIDTLAEKLAEDAVIVDALRAVGLHPSKRDALMASRSAVYQLIEGHMTKPAPAGGEAR